MDFKIDENLPVEVADLLTRAGHTATTVLDQRLGGEADADIALVCQREKRALVTLDTGFADIRVYPPERYSGLVVLRLRWQEKPHVLDVVSRVMPTFLTEPLARRLWIVEETRIRTRR